MFFLTPIIVIIFKFAADNIPDKDNDYYGVRSDCRNSNHFMPSYWFRMTHLPLLDETKKLKIEITFSVRYSFKQSKLCQI